MIYIPIPSMPACIINIVKLDNCSIIVNKEVLILKGERVSKDRKVVMVMKSVLNELSDEVGVVRVGRFRRGRFA